MRFWIFFIHLFACLGLSAQTDVDVLLNQCDIKEELIREYGIQSLIVYAEMNPRGFNGTTDEYGKLREYEFDLNGNTIYQLTASNGGNGYFVYYDKGSCPEFSEYNEANLLVNHTKENLRQISNVRCKYDDSGNITFRETAEENSNFDFKYTYTFDWSNGEMIKCSDYSDSLFPKDITSFFDKKGRVIGGGSNPTRIELTYSELNGKLTKTQTNFRADTVQSSESFTYSTLEEERMVYYVSKDWKGVALNEIVLSYDDFGNVYKIYRKYVEKHFHEAGARYETVTSTVDIENCYDDRGLLTKQYYYRTSSYHPQQYLFQVNSYFYDQDPLTFKFEKGTISSITLGKEPMYDHD